MRLLGVLVCIFVVVMAVSGELPSITEYCTALLANEASSSVSCDVSSCQGRPGKRGGQGIRGVPGPRGEKGEEGSCDDLKSRIKDLEDDMRVLKMSVDQKLEYCGMGMRNGDIPDSAISASSDWDTILHHHNNARLDEQITSGLSVGAWAAETNRVGEWIQVDFGEPKALSGFVTQGRTQYSEWVTSLKVGCGDNPSSLPLIRDGAGEMVFRANTDSDSRVMNRFPQVQTCRYIRLLPQTWRGHISMRMEFMHAKCFELY